MDFYKFFSSADVIDAMKRKIEDTQSKGFVEKKFEGMVGGKKVSFSLPSDVRKQLYIFTISEKFVSNLGYNNEDVETAYSDSLKYLEFVSKNMLVDGEVIQDLNQLETEDLKAYALVYFLEILLPLFHRSATKAEDSVRLILKDYLKK